MISQEIKNQTIDILSSYMDEPPAIFNFDSYESNKSDFYSEFGKNLIVSKYTKVITESEMRQKVFYDFLSYIVVRKEMHEFVETNGIDGFFSNEVVSTYEVADKKIKIPAGMKLSRAFKLFITSDAWSLDHLQTKYSQCINNDGLSGNLCLSIHPFDYLSISQNNNGWRSCQSLDGEYASGTLSLMNDKVTIVAYLTNNKLENIFKSPSLPLWNSKKWRVLVHIDKTRNRIMFSKHYPFTCVELEDEVVEMLKEIYPNNWKKELISSADKESAIGNTRGRSNYNDITTGNNICNQLTNGLESDKILVGSPVACLYCGENDITESQYFSCDECYVNNGYCCDDCGDCGILEDDMYYIESANRHVCWHCYDGHYFTCETCDESYHRDEYNHEYESCEFCAHLAEEIKNATEVENTNEQSGQDIQGES